MVSFAVSDLGSGHQLSQIAGQGVTVPMLEAAAWSLRLWDRSLRTIDTSTDSSTYTTAAVSEGDVTTVTFTQPSVMDPTVVTLRFEPSSFGDSLEVWPSVSLGPAMAADYALDSIEIVLDFAPLEADADWRILWPSAGGEIIREPLMIGSGIYAGLGSRRFATYPGFLEGEETNPAWTQLAVAYVVDGSAALAISTTDIEQRGKVFAVGTDGTSNEFTIRLYPEDNRNTSSFDFPYAIELAPIAGEYFDGLVWHRERMRARGLETFARPKLKQRGDLSDRYKRLAVYFAIDGLEDYPSINWQRYTRDVKAVLELLGLQGNQLITTTYSWGSREMGSVYPNGQFPILGPSIDHIFAMGDEDVVTGAYSWIPVIHPEDPDYAELSPFLVRDDQGDPIEYPLAGPGTLADRTHHLIDWLDSGVRADRLEFWLDKMATAYGKRLRHIYLDAGGAWVSLPSHRAGISSSLRGLGSRAWPEGVRDLYKDARAKFRAFDPQFLISTEHPSEAYIGIADIVSTWSKKLLPANPLVSAVSISEVLFSEYQRFITFDHTLLVVPTIPSYALLWAWNLSWQFHDGKMLVVTSRPGSYAYVAPEPGDEHEAYWHSHWKPLFDFAKRIWVDHNDLLQRFESGEHLRPLSISHIRDLDSNGYQFSNIEDPVSTEVTVSIPDLMSLVHSSVRHDPTDGSVLVKLTHWHTSSPQTVTVSMPRALYPELGETMVVTEVTAGSAEESFAEVQGDISFEVTMQPRSVRLFQLTPRGAARRTARPVFIFLPEAEEIIEEEVLQ